MKLTTPVKPPVNEFTAVDDTVIHLKNNQAYLIAFFRDARCPFCNYRIFELTKRHTELALKGIQIIAVFSAPVEDVEHFITARPRPFPIVADPDSKLHKLFGLEHKNASFMSMMAGFFKFLKGMSIVGMEGINSDSDILPADFLIDKKGDIQYTHYGENYADRMPVSTIFAFAAKQAKVN